MYIYIKESDLVSPSQKQKKQKKKKKERKKESAYLHIASTSLVLLSFLLDSPILYYLIYLFIYFFFVFLTIFPQTHVRIFTKPTTVGNYVTHRFNLTQRRLNK